MSSSFFMTPTLSYDLIQFDPHKSNFIRTSLSSKLPFQRSRHSRTPKYPCIEYLIVLFLPKEIPEVPLVQYIKLKSKGPYD